MNTLHSFDNTSVETILVVILWIVVIFSVVNFALFFVKDKYCNMPDPIGLDLADYLLGSGVAGFFIVIIMCIFLYGTLNRGRLIALLVISGLLGLFYIIWLIVGGIVIFRGNMDCINGGNAVAIYALVFWVISALLVLADTFGKLVIVRHTQLYDNTMAMLYPK